MTDTPAGANNENAIQFLQKDGKPANIPMIDHKLSGDRLSGTELAGAIKKQAEQIKTDFDNWLGEIATARQLLKLDTESGTTAINANKVDEFFQKVLTPRERAVLIAYALSSIQEVANPDKSKEKSD